MSLFERHPIKAIAIVLGLIFIILFIVIEILLRQMGFLPIESHFQMVDKLIVYDNFITDSNGLLKANPKSEAWKAPYNINSDGFRSPEFNEPQKGKKSILIISDSFGWGATAQPITKSFADLLRVDGYDVYNASIPGYGPTEYEAVAKIYISRLKPDYVILAINTGNDLVEEPTPLVPFLNVYHVTNAGWIKGFDKNNKPLTANEAYNYYIVKNNFKVLMGKSSLITLLIVSVRNALVFFKEQKQDPLKKYKYTFDTLVNIQQLAEANQAKFYLMVIFPEGQNCPQQINKRYRHLFNGFNLLPLNECDKHKFTDYPDCHLNNDGHYYVYEKVKMILK